LATNPHTPTQEEIDFANSAMQFVNMIEKEQEEIKSEEPSRLRSLIDAPLRGLVKGVQFLGEAMSGASPEQQFASLSPEQQERIRQDPFIQAQDLRKDRLTEILDQFLPTQDLAPERILERTGELFPMVAGGGSSAGSGLIRSGAASGLREGTRALGGGELAQSLAELPAFLAPGMQKQIPTQGLSTQQQQMLNLGRQMGLTEEQIAPTLSSPSAFRNLLAKFSPRRGRTQEILEESRQAVGGIFDDLRATPQAQTPVTIDSGLNLINDIENILTDIPSGVRGKISADVQDLYASQMTGSDLINFFQDINHNLKGQTKQLSRLKKPIERALESLSPELSQDFKLTNKMFENFASVRDRLTPTLASDLFSILEGMGVGVKGIGSLITGNFPMAGAVFGGFLGTEGLRRLGREVLLSPRFQNLSGRLVTSVKNNSLPLAKSTIKSMSSMISGSGIEGSERVAQEIERVDVEDLIEQLKALEQEQTP
jgi:hypothetical protein